MVRMHLQNQKLKPLTDRCPTASRPAGRRGQCGRGRTRICCPSTCSLQHQFP